MTTRTLPKHFQLLPNEQLVEIVHPHWFAFYRTYAVWALIIAAGVVLFSCREVVASVFPSSHLDLPFSIINGLLSTNGSLQISYDLLSRSALDGLILVTAWWYVLILMGAFVALAKVNGGWMLVFLAIGSLSTAAGVLTGFPTWTPLFGAALCFAGMVMTDRYRRSHYFIITDLRLILYVDFFHLQERDLLLSRLSDLAIDQTLVGRLFDFGTLIPISLSGFGMGADMSMVGVGAQAGPLSVTGALGTSVGVPRARSPHVLFGVPDPHAVHAILEKLIYTNSEVKHLQTITDELKNMKFLTTNESK
ncbi:hypothetical protein AUK40_05405 [Candidatus Wirthbacteria bacterium CG2_30_54_11]|uniref:DUF304 domain-containing protein n=1 Tax=Candidatus Wirthbacteria bacterium CG2_30_54_11 TaxID=1817892 RepID=A0A1J5IFZ8_9BACT|nr:MAG: hypothetical protein AUK40_05405 [Candidatus Wirthbacteria bacterium CG2_30_54_11]